MKGMVYNKWPRCSRLYQNTGNPLFPAKAGIHSSLLIDLYF